MDCINLRETFGDCYKIGRDEAYAAEYGDGARRDDPWLQQIECRNGTICPWGGSKLAACTRALGSVAKDLRKLPFAEIAMDGSDGVNAVFDVADFDAIAEIMKPRRVRRYSEEQRRKMAERIAKYRFGPARRDADAA